MRGDFNRIWSIPLITNDVDLIQHWVYDYEWRGCFVGTTRVSRPKLLELILLQDPFVRTVIASGIMPLLLMA